MSNKQTLCWKCNHHAHCSWMKSCEPVNGWQAESAQLRQRQNGKSQIKIIDTFHVIECPEFKPYDIKAEEE